jgi:hypothetical protein
VASVDGVSVATAALSHLRRGLRTAPLQPAFKAEHHVESAPPLTRPARPATQDACSALHVEHGVARWIGRLSATPMRRAQRREPLSEGQPLNRPDRAKEDEGKLVMAVGLAEHTFVFKGKVSVRSEIPMFPGPPRRNLA